MSEVGNRTDSKRTGRPEKRVTEKDLRCPKTGAAPSVAFGRNFGDAVPLLSSCVRLLMLDSNYFADAGNTGNFSRSRASCWMMTLAFRFDAMLLMRSIDATDCARS